MKDVGRKCTFRRSNGSFLCGWDAGLHNKRRYVAATWCSDVCSRHKPSWATKPNPLPRARSKNIVGAAATRNHSDVPSLRKPAGYVETLISNRCINLNTVVRPRMNNSALKYRFSRHCHNTVGGSFTPDFTLLGV